MSAPTLRAAGFFRELEYGDEADPSMADAVGRGDRRFKEAILAYLAGGGVIHAVFMVTADVLDEAGTPIGPLVMRTDGTWIWPSDLAYYVDLYDVALPDAFVEHMARHSWTAPRLEESDLEALARDAASLGTQESP